MWLLPVPVQPSPLNPVLLVTRVLVKVLAEYSSNKLIGLRAALVSRSHKTIVIIPLVQICAKFCYRHANYMFITSKKGKTFVICAHFIGPKNVTHMFMLKCIGVASYGALGHMPPSTSS